MPRTMGRQARRYVMKGFSVCRPAGGAGRSACASTARMPGHPGGATTARAARPHRPHSFSFCPPLRLFIKAPAAPNAPARRHPGPQHPTNGTAGRFHNAPPSAPSPGSLPCLRSNSSRPRRSTMLYTWRSVTPKACARARWLCPVKRARIWRSRRLSS